MTAQTEDLTDPLFGPLPTWRMDDDSGYWETARTLGWQPSELDARVQPFPAATGPVAEAAGDVPPVAEDDTRPIPLKAFTERAAGLAVAS